MKKEVNNTTQNTGFVNSVTANDSDVLEFRIWVHNKIVGSIAKDLVVKDKFPIKEGQVFVNEATVSGSNFTTISDKAIVTTEFFGRLEYIPGTTRVFGHADDTDGELVADVNGKSKLFGNGVKFAEMKGCFEFERFVIFQAKVIKPEVLGPPPPTKLPDTGPGTAGMILLFGSVPAGIAFRFLRRTI